jgi:hypothetical protein
MAFQIFNRTIWTNNKAFKSRKRLKPGCERCGRTETMEHFLCECEYYSKSFGTGWVRFWRSYSTQVPRVDPGPTNIIYNIPHPSTLLHISDRTMWNTQLLLIQKVKRDIIYRRMDLSASFSTTRHWSTTTCYSPRLYPAQTSFIPPIHRNCQICQSNRVPITITVGAISINRASKNFAPLRPNISGHGNDRKLCFFFFLIDIRQDCVREVKICKNL